MTRRGSVRRLQPGDAGVDEACLLAAGDDLDRMAEDGLRARTRKASRFLASRSVCVATARTWLRREAVEPAREAGQAVEAARRRLLVEEAGGVEAGAEADRLLQVVDAPVAAVDCSWPISSRKLFEPMSIAAS